MKIVMNQAIKSVLFASSPPSACSCSSNSFISMAFFHSTPVLERKRGSRCYYGRISNKSKRYNYYAKMRDRIESKKKLLTNMSDYAEYLFQDWKAEVELNRFLSNNDAAWFRRPYWSKGAKLNGFSSNQTPHGRYNKRRGDFNFCASSSDDDDDDDVETIFHSAFGGQGFYYWSFDSSENFSRGKRSGKANHTNCWNWRYETDEEVDSSLREDLASERSALGLKSSGPLLLEEVKKAYRTCALRWHPDRHQGSSKAVAEEKFKHCSAAYKSLCEKLTVQ